MNDSPSEPLIELLARLRLVSAGQVQSQAAQVRRLAGDLPPLDSIWVDALAQARLLTPYQAAQINAGRGENLAIGPYVLVRPLGAFGFADCFEGRHVEDQTTARVYLLGRAHREPKILLAELEQLIARSARVAPIGSAHARGGWRRSRDGFGAASAHAARPGPRTALPSPAATEFASASRFVRPPSG